MEIEFKNVSYTYDSIEKKEVLKEITTKIIKEKINIILGPSGSGKTTFIELINGLLLPSKGKIKVGNFIIGDKKKIKNIKQLRFDVGLVFQFPEEQFFKETVKKEIAFGMEYFKYKLNVLDKRIIDSLKMVGLDESYLNCNPLELSDGEKRKVAIASILVFNPKVLILDEPTVGLDNKSRKDLVRLILRLKKHHKKTVIIVSHDLDVLYPIGDNYIVLSEGKLLKNGNREEVFKNIRLLKKHNIVVPKIVEFINRVKEKKDIKLGDEDNTRDLMKAIYRNV
ncbi:MAG: ATP-binding cassette domain-containing protein [Bacilli bacterium]